MQEIPGNSRDARNINDWALGQALGIIELRANNVRLGVGGLESRDSIQHMSTVYSRDTV